MKIDNDELWDQLVPSSFCTTPSFPFLMVQLKLLLLFSLVMHEKHHDDENDDEGDPLPPLSSCYILEACCPPTN